MGFFSVFSRMFHPGFIHSFFFLAIIHFPKFQLINIFSFKVTPMVQSQENPIEMAHNAVPCVTL